MGLDDFIDKDSDSLDQDTIRELKRMNPPDGSEDWSSFEPSPPEWWDDIFKAIGDGQIDGEKFGEIVVVAENTDDESEKYIKSSEFVDLEDEI